MTELLSQAAAGKRGALESLIEITEKNIMFFCRALLPEEEANAVFAEAYGEMLEKVLGGFVASEQEFENMLKRLAALKCREYILKSKPQALRIPQNKNFIIEVPIASGEVSVAVLDSLPTMQKFLFALRRIAGLHDDDIAKIARIDSGTLRAAFQAERTNLDMLLEKYRAKTDSASPANAKEFMEALQTAQSECTIPADTAEKVRKNMNMLIAPIEKAHKKSTAGKIITVVLAVAVIGGLAVGGVFLSRSLGKGSTSGAAPSGSSGAVSSYTAENASVTAYADIDIKDYGTVTVALDGKAAPATVKNFEKLANSGFYNGLTFHRIIDGFMMQGGDPDGDGTGDSDDTVSGEFSANGFNNSLSHTRGAISMARSNDYNSASSQFFIVQSDSTFLDGQYAAFGYVTEGMDIVDSICKAASTDDSNGLQAKDKQPVINSVTIRSAE